MNEEDGDELLSILEALRARVVTLEATVKKLARYLRDEGYGEYEIGEMVDDLDLDDD